MGEVADQVDEKLREIVELPQDPSRPAYTIRIKYLDKTTDAAVQFNPGSDVWVTRWKDEGGLVVHAPTRELNDSRVYRTCRSNLLFSDLYELDRHVETIRFWWHGQNAGPAFTKMLHEVYPERNTVDVLRTIGKRMITKPTDPYAPYFPRRFYKKQYITDDMIDNALKRCKGTLNEIREIKTKSGKNTLYSFPDLKRHYGWIQLPEQK